MTKKTSSSTEKLDKLVADSQRNREQREQDYRERALKMYPWVCGRCSREFTRTNLSELTVHHRDHNHDNNPADGSNWELLCLYCHDNEHARQLDNQFTDAVADKKTKETHATHKPFGDLASLIKNKS